MFFIVIENVGYGIFEWGVDSIESMFVCPFWMNGDVNIRCGRWRKILQNKIFHNGKIMDALLR